MPQVVGQAIPPANPGPAGLLTSLNRVTQTAQAIADYQGDLASFARRNPNSITMHSGSIFELNCMAVNNVLQRPNVIPNSCQTAMTYSNGITQITTYQQNQGSWSPTQDHFFYGPDASLAAVQAAVLGIPTIHLGQPLPEGTDFNNRQLSNRIANVWNQ